MYTGSCKNVYFTGRRVCWYFPLYVVFFCLFVYLDSVIFFVANIYESKGVRRDSPGIVEPAVTGTLTSERPQKPTGRIQDL